MTQPNPSGDEGKKDEGKPKVAPKVKRGDVVHFTAVDTHTGDEFDGLGVVAVVSGGGAVTVRPLAGYTVQAADVEHVVTDEG